MPARTAWRDAGCTLIAIEKPFSRGPAIAPMMAVYGALLQLFPRRAAARAPRDDWRSECGIADPEAARRRQRLAQAARARFAREQWRRRPPSTTTAPRRSASPTLPRDRPSPRTGRGMTERRTRVSALAAAPTGDEELSRNDGQAVRAACDRDRRVEPDADHDHVLRLVVLDRSQPSDAKLYNDLKAGRLFSLQVDGLVKGAKTTHQRDSEGNIDAVAETKTLVIDSITVND
jgi:hypothetical protein